jgi:anti-anti-sigma regulatory factor
MARASFACAFDEQTRTLTLSGDVDEAGACELRRQLAALMQDHVSSVIMDLSSVHSLPGSVVGEIASARAGMRARFATLTLVAPQGSLARGVLARFGMSARDA